MKRLLVVLAGVIFAACAAQTGDADLDSLEAQTECTGAPGQQLFEQETFGGNGRTCASCHRDATRTVSPDQANALFQANPDDPLFQGDAADNFGTDAIEICVVSSVANACKVKKQGIRCRTKTQGLITFECETSFRRFLTHATINVGITPHAGVLVDGVGGKAVFLSRGVPTSVNTPALDPVLMFDGRAPDLRAQAASALEGHAGVTGVCTGDLDAIAGFEQTEFSRPELAAYAQGGPTPQLPPGNTESERRGRVFFEPGVQFRRRGFCGQCHGGPMLDTMSVSTEVPAIGDQFPGLFVPAGDRFITAMVSEANEMGNRTHIWTLLDGPVPRTIVSPDIGRAAITGFWKDVNKFKIATLWGVSTRGPYFHDSSAKSLAEVVEHYANFMVPIFQPFSGGENLTLSAQDQADIVAYLELL